MDTDREHAFMNTVASFDLVLAEMGRDMVLAKKAIAILHKRVKEIEVRLNMRHFEELKDMEQDELFEEKKEERTDLGGYDADDDWRESDESDEED